MLLDNIKALGFKYSTIGALTVAVADIDHSRKQIHPDRRSGKAGG